VNSLLRQRYTQVANVHGAVMWTLREPAPEVAVFGSNVPMRRA